ncbi:hypothetical protein SAMN05892877_103200 [Rhizobium subbaraonis]|uniref:Alkaline proteinase inhibitor/ Outer membrane lipoprotein Omp19 domain-containing protein n=1 Tax=Rhizobium subbaraonis TaxID=908946 RepID=A0A285U9A0_9HYPH|nr:hypothetical protein [Rhizobium subbaraonis]SOC36861.1 hypothetical protein SAMN05892877_103200 [Rhizobium subbaraonis]
MRKVIIPSIGALALVAGLWSLDADSAPDVDPVVSGSIPKIGRAENGVGFSVSNIETKAQCSLTRGEKLTHRSMRLTPEGPCEDVWPGLSHAANWTETGDGTVVVSGVTGDAILTLAETDGLYEVIDPSNAVITMQAAH